MTNSEFNADKDHKNLVEDEQPILPSFLFRDVLKSTTQPDMRSFISAGMRRVHSQLSGKNNN